MILGGTYHDELYQELQKRRRSHMNQILPCTGHEQPVTLLLDKGTIKHDTGQLTLVRTPSLKAVTIFESFFINNTNVVQNGVGVLTYLGPVSKLSLNLPFHWLISTSSLA